MTRGGSTNTSLFRSPHAVIALTVVIAAGSWLLWKGATPGRGAGSDRGFLLLSGWAALTLFLVVMAYVLRKYAHEGGYSPEFRLRVPIEALERTERRLDELRAKVLARVLADRGEIEAEARRLLDEERVARVLRVEIVASGESPVLVRTRWTEPLGRVARWLHAHLFYGLAALAMVALHGGIAPVSPIGWLLAVGTLVVTATGLWGIVTWARGPAWLTRKERELGLSIEMAHGLATSLERGVAAAMERVDEDARTVLLAVQRAGRDLPARARLALEQLERDRDPEKIAAVRDALVLIGQRRRVRDAAKELARVRRRFMGWRVVHVPVAWLLLGGVMLHAISVWLY
jgi:hypothetical protein